MFSFSITNSQGDRRPSHRLRFHCLCTCQPVFFPDEGGTARRLNTPFGFLDIVTTRATALELSARFQRARGKSVGGSARGWWQRGHEKMSPGGQVPASFGSHKIEACFGLFFSPHVLPPSGAGVCDASVGPDRLSPMGGLDPEGEETTSGGKVSLVHGRHHWPRTAL